MHRIAPVLVAVLTLAACGSDDGVSVENAWSRASAPGQTSGVVYFDLTVPDDDILLAASVPSSVASRAEIHEVIVDEVAAGDMSAEMSTDSGMETSADGTSGDMEMSGDSDDVEMSGEMSTDSGTAMSDDAMSGDVEMSADMDDMEMSAGSHDMDTGGGTGTMRMQEMTDGLALVGGETVLFEPGGYHVMLPGLVEPLEVGDEFELTLDFAEADDVTVTVGVAETAP